MSPVQHVLLVVVIAAAVVGGIYWYMLGMPGRIHTGPLPALTDDERALAAALRRHVVALASGPRNTSHPAALEKSARYIEALLSSQGHTPRAQGFTAGGVAVRNIEVVIEPATGGAGGALVIGAHYDSFADSPGANDNATGAAALLELARLLKSRPPPASRLRLVFFVNEEPPHFRTEAMGSLRYARALAASGEPVRGMLSLETLGHYSDAPGSQRYPYPLSLALPDTGNFVAIVGTFGTRAFAAEVTRRFRETTAFPSVGGVAPAFMAGIDWSDHWSFGQLGIPALMITDTALYRYPHYHRTTDTPDKIDFDRLARVTQGLARMIAALAG